MINYYTGIGSRKTTKSVQDLFSRIGTYLESKGYWLRSGGADGADSAFESGVKEKKQIWLPWKNFNNNSSTLILPNNLNNHLKIITELNIISESHFSNLNGAAVKLHCRNINQVIGFIENPIYSNFVLCWTDEGKQIGGTATAIKYAELLGIPVYNFGKCNHISKMYEYWERIVEIENLA